MIHDIITFKFILTTFDDHPYIETHIFINEEDLIDRVRSFEKNTIKESVGTTDYIGMPPDALLRNLDHDRKSSMIFACGSCGEAGCWPILVDVEHTDETVIWKNFRQPHRGELSKGGFWDYSSFPKFTFNKQQYEAALTSLKTAAAN